jgi:hypothetical protein
VVIYREQQERSALEPEFGELDRLCLDAWIRLDTCRPLGWAAAGSIPTTSVLEWCGFKNLDRELTQLVLDVLEILDDDRAKLIAAKRALDNQGGKR